MAIFDALLEALASRYESPDVANPYRGPAGAWRRDNLRRYLTQVAAHRPAVALIGEAPGYRGCAVTGVPFTSRQVLSADTGRWGLLTPRSAGSVTGDAGEYVAHEGLGQPWAEATATLVWRHVPRVLDAPPLLGNAFPFHPHPRGSPRGNRPLSATELAEGSTYLGHLLGLFPGVRAIAVGRQAERALGRLGIAPFASLRHPAHGGATSFARGLRSAAHSMSGTIIERGRME